MIKYPKNSLFKLFVYHYFEKETLQHCTATLMSLLQNYIVECCQKIRLFVDSSLVKNYGVYEGEGYFQSGNFLKGILVYQLEWQKRSFILKVATLKDELIDWEAKRANDRQETLELLANDRKFVAALEEYGGEFRKGYDALMRLRKMILIGMCNREWISIYSAYMTHRINPKCLQMPCNANQ
ncbi:MAG: hypothetical protein WAK17_20605 [Candidatus Nitrosopolaris sp.]